MHDKKAYYTIRICRLHSFSVQFKALLHTMRKKRAIGKASPKWKINVACACVRFICKYYIHTFSFRSVSHRSSSLLRRNFSTLKHENLTVSPNLHSKLLLNWTVNEKKKRKSEKLKKKKLKRMSPCQFSRTLFVWYIGSAACTVWQKSVPMSLANTIRDDVQKGCGVHSLSTHRSVEYASVLMPPPVSCSPISPPHQMQLAVFSD